MATGTCHSQLERAEETQNLYIRHHSSKRCIYVYVQPNTGKQNSSMYNSAKTVEPLTYKSVCVYHTTSI